MVIRTNVVFVGDMLIVKIFYKSAQKNKTTEIFKTNMKWFCNCSNRFRKN